MGINFTSVSTSEGSNNLSLYCNDSVGNENQTSIIFLLDSINPNINITSPINATHTSNTGLDVNYTYSDPHNQTCWWSNDSYEVNQTLASCGVNITTITWSEGLHNVTVWINDTAGNLNFSSVSFIIDTINPDIVWAHPPNAGFIIISNLSYNLSVNVTDPYLDAINLTIKNSSGEVVYKNFTSGILVTIINVSDNITLASGNNTIEVCGRDSLSGSKKINDVAKFNKQNEIRTLFEISDEVVIYRDVRIVDSKEKLKSAKSEKLATTDEWVDDGKHYKTTWKLNSLSSDSYFEIKLSSQDTELDLLTDRGVTRVVDKDRNYYWRFDDMEEAGYAVDYKQVDVRTVLIEVRRGSVRGGSQMTMDPIVGGLNNYCESRNITVDISTPNVTINSPTATTYSVSEILFNATAVDNIAVSSCWFSTNSGATNTTMDNFVGNFWNFTNSSMADATYTAQFYCNDSTNNLNNSESVSFTISTAVASPVPGGGTGGGGGGGSVPKLEGLEANPKEITLFAVVNETKKGEIELENLGGADLSISVVLQGIGNFVKVSETFFLLKSGEKKKIKFDVFSPSKPGTYPGKIAFNSLGKSEQVLFILNVKSEKSLFDIGVDILDEFKNIKIGEKVSAQISLLQAGVKEKMDVTLNYVIKDFEGKDYLIESETIAVFDQKSYFKEFDTRDLIEGDYLLATEIVYPGGIATASSHFTVSDGEGEKLVGFTLIAVLIVALIVFALTIAVIQKYKKVNLKYKSILRGKKRR